MQLVAAIYVGSLWRQHISGQDSLAEHLNAKLWPRVVMPEVAVLV